MCVGRTEIVLEKVDATLDFDIDIKVDDYAESVDDFELDWESVVSLADCFNMCHDPHLNGSFMPLGVMGDQRIVPFTSTYAIIYKWKECQCQLNNYWKVFYVAAPQLRI
ncbi:hypothetical protein D3C86_1295840 [compost metagenome]